MLNIALVNLLKNKISYILTSILILIIFIYSSVFIVPETKSCFIIRFGKIIQKKEKSGLNFKIPIIDNIIFFEKRIININLEQAEVITKDQKRFTIDAIAKYKIKDKDIFYKTLRNEQSANNKIKAILNSLVRQIIGTKYFMDILNKDRSIVMSEIEQKFDETLKRYGIQCIDVRIVKVDLPNENSSAIFERMITERQKEAAELRRSGEKEAQIIISESEKEAEIIRSNALLKAREIDAISKAKALEIENKIYSKDLTFYEFYRKLNIYKKIKNKTLIISEKTLKEDNILTKNWN